VHTVHGWSFNDSQPAWKRRLFIWLERLCAHFSSRLIIVSDHDLRIGLRLHIGRPGKYQRINYGIDYAEFQRPASEARRAFSLAAGDLAVGTVSCFKPQKSPQDFIRLAGAVKNQVHQVKFILAGDGILRRQIERLIKRHKLEDSVLLLGWRRDIPQILSSLDVLVLTSLWEGLPIAVLEAMAASLPVVATDTGGIAEIVSDGKTGFLKKPQDVAGLAERLITLLRDADLRKSMGRAGKEALGETFRLEKMQKSYYNLYSELLRTKGRQDDNE
jgi:glycosyltransferase involved in cell wall biosynthesis